MFDELLPNNNRSRKKITFCNRISQRTLNGDWNMALNRKQHLLLIFSDSACGSMGLKVRPYRTNTPALVSIK